MSFTRCFPIVGDLELTADGRDLVFVSGADKVRQNIKSRAGILKGSWRYDRSKGVPYFDDILVAGASVALVRRRFYELILGTDGVTAVTSCNVRFDSKTETVFVDFEAVADGELIVDTLAYLQAVAQSSG